MPPLPIVPLIPGSLLVVRTITSMVLHQVAPVRMIFTIIPIMVVAMMRIIDSYLYAFLGPWCCHDCRGRKNSSS